MDRLIILIIIIALLVPAKTFAQDMTMQEQATNLVRKSKGATFTSLSVENDSLGGGTDRNYTSGIRATYFHVGANIPHTIDKIADYVPTFDINETTSIAWSLGQNLYTPDAIKSPQQDPNDRPWAAWLYGSAALGTVTDNHIDELELTLGIVGPMALGEIAQETIHSWIGSPDPKGWDNQLDNEPGFIVSWQRRWPQVATFESCNLHASFQPNINISLGNIYTYAGTGLTFKVSPANARWQDTPPRVRPAMPGTGYFLPPDNGWSWYLFAGVDGRAMGRNIFLDGNTFSDSHSVHKKTFVLDANAGLALTYKNTRLSYSMNYRTKEFETQEEDEIFGSLTLTFRY